MTLELKDTNVLQFNPDALQDVRKEHGLDHNGMCQALDILLEWIQKQDHFVKKDFQNKYATRHQLILRTIRGRKTVCINMPKQTEDNCRIYIMQVKGNVTAAELLETYKFSIIMSEYVKLKDYSDGVYGILDIRNVNIMEFIPSFNPMDARNAVSLYMDGYGFRVKAIYILSSSKTINVFVNLVRPLFPAKVGQRIQVFPDVESLHQYLPKHLLPEDYGGEQKSISTIFDNWTEELSSEEHVKYMKKTRQFCTNESLRRSDTFTDEYLGMPGSFKLLTVD